MKAKANPKNILMFELVSISFTHKGERGALKSATRHEISSALTWPRAGFESRTYVSELSMPKGSAERSFTDAEWTEAILMKETVQAPSAFTLQVSAPLRGGKLGTVARAAIKAAFGVLGDLADKAIPIAPIGGAAEGALDQIGALVKDSDADFFAAGTVMLTSDLVANGGDLKIDLCAKRALRRRVANGNGKTARVVEEVKAGAEVGTAVVRVTVIE